MRVCLRCLMVLAVCGAWTGCARVQRGEFAGVVQPEVLARSGLHYYAHYRLDLERGDDTDKICSAFYAACWEAATGDVIPGRPWFRWALPIRRGRCVPTPGAVARYLEGLGCRPVELVRG